MIVFLLLIVVLLIGLTAAAVMGRISGFMAEPTSSQSALGQIEAGSPSTPLSAEDVGRVRFSLALRGYRMDQVDGVIDALSTRLQELETEVGALRTLAVSSGADSVRPGSVSS